MQAVARQLVRRDIAPDLARFDTLVQQVTEEATKVLFSVCHMAASMQEKTTSIAPNRA
ncbi:hypothetical protein GCM10022206_22580 [Streptomyces chiangmaiensis]